MNRLDELWGSMLVGIEVNLDMQRVGIDIVIPASDAVPIGHHLDFAGVQELRYLNRIPSPWEYSELTEIRTHRLPSGNVQTELILWSEDATLTIESQSVTLDGSELI